MCSMSSSSDYDDKSAKEILESADLNLLTNSLYVSDNVNNAEETEESYSVDRKSQRYLDYEEYFDTYLKIPELMQNYFYNKLSTLIRSRIDLSDVETNVAQGNSNTWRNRVRLLHDSEMFVDDLKEDDQVKIKKSKINRRLVDTEALSVIEKIASSAVSHSEILLGIETKYWVNRKKGQVFTYKKSKTGGTLHLIDANNEFSTLRKKNCWSEKYIPTKKLSQVMNRNT